MNLVGHFIGHLIESVRACSHGRYSASRTSRTVVASPTASDTKPETAIAHHAANGTCISCKNGNTNKSISQARQIRKKYLSRLRIKRMSHLGQQRGVWRLIRNVCQALNRCPHSGQHLALCSLLRTDMFYRLEFGTRVHPWLFPFPSAQMPDARCQMPDFKIPNPPNHKPELASPCSSPNS